MDTQQSIIVSKDDVELRGKKFTEELYGRVIAEDVINSHGVTILKAGDLLTKENVKMVEDSEIDMVRLRSPLTCDTVSGVCQKCYGMDLATRDFVDMGTPVGIIASQSIGEPATQLTMRTFHGGGVASKTGDMATVSSVSSSYLR